MNITLRYFLSLLFMANFCYGYAKIDEAQKINNLKDSIELYFYTNPLIARAYISDLERESERQKDISNMTFAKAKLVEYYYPQFDNDSIIAAAESAETFARQHKQYNLMFIVQQTLVQRYVNQGMFTLGLSKARQMYDEASKMQDNINMARATAALANIYKHMDEYKESAEYLQESLRLLKQTDNWITSVQTLEAYTGLAYLGLNLEQYEQTILYTDSVVICIDIRHEKKNRNDPESAFEVEYLLARANIGLNRLEEAKKHIINLDKQYNEGDYPLTFRFLLDGTYIAYHKARKEYEEAYNYNERLLQLAQEYQLSPSLPGILIEKGELLMHLNRYYDAAQAYAEAIKDQNEENHSNSSRQLNELRIFYDLNKVEQQAHHARMQLQFTQRIIIAITMVVFLLIVLAIIISRNSRRIKLKNIGLVKQIQEQDRLNKQMEGEKLEFERLRRLLKETTGTVFKEDPDELLEKLLNLMTEARPYTNPNLNRKSLAEALGTNEKYLRETIKKHYKLTVNEYITDLRLMHAKNLLMLPSEKYTIERIAIESGFGSRITFHILFRERYGLAPDEFRKFSTE